jgi:cyclic beta-1,2-glucan synthetase
MTTVDLAPGASVTVVAVLGQAASEESCAQLVDRYRHVDRDALRSEVARQWDRILEAGQIRTPDRSVDVRMNRWLLYQTVSCRLWGRAGFYQAGGAFGFRDQLQDSLALIATAPTLVSEHLLLCASRQFEAGDVQHWWHPPSGRGVRTRCVDDRVWLPFVVLRYLAVTADEAILDEEVPFLVARPLQQTEPDAHFEPTISARKVSLYEHCALALEASSGTGPHGLPLMGGGDWNDGMNRVGHLGNGESTWMAWLLCAALPAFSDLAVRRGDNSRAIRWRTLASRIAAATESEAWDGAWYRRGYFDDGTPLGSANRPECRIDSLAQSWAVLSGAADPARAMTAMAAVGEYLVRPADDLVLLFTPPFDTSEPDPGYIRGYVPGLRENGGQYTHAAVWYLMAEARLGHARNVSEILDMINPVRRAATRRKALVYRVEPYVVAADVGSEAPNAQRGGWTWYTGAAGWLYQALLEDVLGLRFRATTLAISPAIPPQWPRANVRYRASGYDYAVAIERAGTGNALREIRVDGTVIEGTVVSLSSDGKRHDVQIVVGV